MEVEEVALGGSLFKSKGVCHLQLINSGSCTEHLLVNSELLAGWVFFKRIKKGFLSRAWWHIP